MERKIDIRKGALRKALPLADGAGMAAEVEEILFSVALPEDAGKPQNTFSQATDDAKDELQT